MLHQGGTSAGSNASSRRLFVEEFPALKESARVRTDRNYRPWDGHVLAVGCPRMSGRVRAQLSQLVAGATVDGQARGIVPAAQITS